MKALVVGGASGIGRGCAEELAARGWDVAVADLRGGDFSLDVRDADAVAAVVESVGPLDGCVMAAGTARVTPVTAISAKEWELVLGVNLTGTFNVVRAAGAAGALSIVALS